MYTNKIIACSIHGVAKEICMSSCFTPTAHVNPGVDGYWDWEGRPPPQHFQGDYFFYHHTIGDTVSVLSSEQMDRASATLAVHAYAYANLEHLLPRGPWSAFPPLSNPRQD